MRRKIIVANWKMNTSLDEAINLIIDIKNLIGDDYAVLCVPYTHLGTAQELADDRIGIGAQNLCSREEGAYTGEISGKMLASFGVEYVIVGHSERRKYFSENNTDINAKLKIAIKNDLSPILCFGESLEQRDKGNYLEIIKTQVEEALQDLNAQDLSSVILAYEPIWAIGTGQTASPQQAQEVHVFVRKLISENYSPELANKICILYGGSVKSSNAKEIFKEKDIDGALVGGASLNASEFIKIVKAI
ncbi:MAG: triose-phosphate isomerase [Chitinophagales bacterium]|nr:triose-phosphate isomerase [Chitinophagales bacterium]